MKHLWWCPFFSKATGLGLLNYLKRKPLQVFSWEIYNIFQTTVLLNTCMVPRGCHGEKLNTENNKISKNKKNNKNENKI